MSRQIVLTGRVSNVVADATGVAFTVTTLGATSPVQCCSSQLLVVFACGGLRHNQLVAVIGSFPDAIDGLTCLQVERLEPLGKALEVARG